MEESKLFICFTETAFSFLIFKNNSYSQYSITGNLPGVFGGSPASSVNAEKIISSAIKLKGEQS